MISENSVLKASVSSVIVWAVVIPTMGFPVDSVVKNPPANAGNTGDTSLIPGLGRSQGVGNGNPLQYSCLENSMDRGAWQAAVHRVTESEMTEAT